jgi:dihydrodipicolinate synthase/N-acetylneuraminate lyase
VGIKHAMSVVGRDTGELRLPLCEASESTKSLIASLVRQLGT